MNQSWIALDYSFQHLIQFRCDVWHLKIDYLLVLHVVSIISLMVLPMRSGCSEFTRQHNTPVHFSFKQRLYIQQLFESLFCSAFFIIMWPKWLLFSLFWNIQCLGLMWPCHNKNVKYKKYCKDLVMATVMRLAPQLICQRGIVSLRDNLFLLCKQSTYFSVFWVIGTGLPSIWPLRITI